MVQTYTQADRLLTIDTTLGTDVLLLVEFHGREAVSDLFSYDATALSLRDDIRAEVSDQKLVASSGRCGRGPG
ncbi:MAG: hypothetical protein WCO00_17390, partial [Rhodospirillaceae bacterium]